LGFAGLALQAGIPSAIATLWQVSDLGTVALMGEFYRQLKADKSKAVALQRAQIALRSGRVALEGNQSPAGIAVDCAATGEPDGNDLPGFFPSLLLGGLFPDLKPLIGVPATCHSFL
jgi:CHAT domain-containing protein